MARKKATFPQVIKPQLVQPAARPPAGDWQYEIKLDGYRMLARIEGTARLFTRNQYDWTHRMPLLAKELGTLRVNSAWIDGEVVVQDEDGRPSFSRLQSAFSTGKTAGIVYFAFDLLFLNGEDLRQYPVETRREALAELLSHHELDRVRLSETLEADPHQLLMNVCSMQLEGLVGKRIGSQYRSERNGDWIKLKCGNRQEFVIVGYTRAGGGIGSLLIGIHDDAGKLTYAGRVRSGFSGKTLDTLKSSLSGLQCPTTPLSREPDLRSSLAVVWVKPEVVCEVKFAEITPKGKVRHAVFVALREDKPAAGISLESDNPEP